MAIRTPSQFPPPQEKLLGPEACEEYGKALTWAISQLALAGLRVPRHGRLYQAADLLDRVARARRFPEDRLGQRSVANAMADASDYYDIMQTLPPAELQRISSEVQRAMKGDNRSPRRGSAVFQVQAQLWLASVLTRGGYRPRVPEQRDGIRSPDFLIEEGMSVYGAEVKRPGTELGARRQLAKAATQLRDYGVLGCVLMDLSECVGLEELEYVSQEAARATSDRCLERTHELSMRLSDQIIDRSAHRRRAGYENIMGLFTIARGFSWISGNGSGLAMTLSGGVHAQVPVVRNLLYHHTIDVLDRAARGLHACGYGLESFRDLIRANEGKMQ
jgi:hypothetical protein